ncbi:hypothetical protein LshimejAT787_1502450 [Lyophyllum shimeji]|uniref:Retrotransposon gag domain-containing protein n=1 Tax=Lyophyllum shimeji TaxID=47721 RepID=A0A9P3PYP3_LYOSH|nr:hypothetical protein LshimejAT787_1502450 [Lyophyllum shimeji]
MKGGRAARFAAAHSAIPIPMRGPRFDAYAEFAAQFIAEFCPRDEKRNAPPSRRPPTPGSRSVDEYIDEFQDLAEEAQFPDGAQLVFASATS